MKITKIAKTEFSGKGVIIDESGTTLSEASYSYEVAPARSTNVGFSVERVEVQNVEKISGRLVTSIKLIDSPGVWFLQFEDKRRLKFEELIDFSDDEAFGVYTFEGIILEKE